MAFLALPVPHHDALNVLFTNRKSTQNIIKEIAKLEANSSLRFDIDASIVWLSLKIQSRGKVNLSSIVARLT